MSDQSLTQEQVRGTGTWNLNVPVSLFSVATYRDADGRLIQMPVGVAGEHITGQFQGTARSQS